MNLDEKIKTIAEHYGFYIQLNKLAEECAEFSASTLKLEYLLRLSWDKDLNVQDEIEEAAKGKDSELADVLLLARQIEFFMTVNSSLKSRIEKIMNEKAERQLKRIKEE